MTTTIMARQHRGFRASHYAADGRLLESKLYKSEAAAQKRANFLRMCFPYARVEVTAEAQHALGEAL
jgi:hypothetical protein